MPDGLSDREHLKKMYVEGPSSLLLDMAERITRLEGAALGATEQRLDILRDIAAMRLELRDANITMLQRDIADQGKELSALKITVAENTMIIRQARTGLSVGMDMGRAIWAFVAAVGGAALTWFLSRGK
jgi:hypothetical protein